MGVDSRQRLRVMRTLWASGVNLLCLMIYLAAVYIGLIDRFDVFLTTAFMLGGALFFYIAIRSGWSLRLSDPALTMPQMIYFMSVAAFAYVVVPPFRGVMTVTMALILVFGAFILSPLRCRQLGWLAVALVGIALGITAIRTPNSIDAHVGVVHFLVSAIVLPVIALLAGQLSAIRFVQKAQKRALTEALEKVRRLATQDELTGLPNRRKILELLSLEERKARRQLLPLTCAMIDIDHFKRINDSHGHQAGDDTLVLFSSLLSSELRAGDVLGRWGGEEFILLLPATPLAEATAVVERLRVRCDKAGLWAQRPELKVTFSAGLATHRPDDALQVTIARADGALYKAKAEGRNRVVSN